MLPLKPGAQLECWGLVCAGLWFLASWSLDEVSRSNFPYEGLDFITRVDLILMRAVIHGQPHFSAVSKSLMRQQLRFGRPGRRRRSVEGGPLPAPDSRQTW